MKLNIILLLGLLTLLTVSPTWAQKSLDMTTGEMENSHLFIPHLNDCSGSEAFVQVGASASKGYCIETSERTAATFEDARQTCAALGKRLPEVPEFQRACRQAGALGISNMTDNLEWSSNFTSLIVTDWVSGSLVIATIVPTIGNGSCVESGAGMVSALTSAGVTQSQTNPFHCLH